MAPPASRVGQNDHRRVWGNGDGGDREPFQSEGGSDRDRLSEATRVPDRQIGIVAPR
ncbi:MAG: hypothetical protein AVDCRST_MAG73-3434 [uncultured Thermomicrobiales bacterium]|uniref:Uncharacterized protein n=1 Tax=uncultured Thermomicrobiales bacterium TaxID=1645740 RepID=A0A6J4UVB7_9BACT|nr:MAG: hypothetical protein AVDCRST_MAG73-3434 [uncultured Thermomicrobiales bacterium]